MSDFFGKILCLFFALGLTSAYTVEVGDTIIVKNRINRTQDDWYLVPGSHKVFALTSDGTVVVRSTGLDKVIRDYVVPVPSYINTVRSYRGISSGNEILLKKKAPRETDTWFMYPGVRKIGYVGVDGTLVENLKCSDGVTRDFLYSPDAYVTLTNKRNGIIAGKSSIFLKEKIQRGTDEDYLYPGVRSVDFIGSDGTLVSRFAHKDYLFSPSSYMKLVSQFKGIKPNDSVILTRRAPNISKADDWTMRPGVRTITHIREDGTLLNVSKDSDGETRHYVLSLDIYVPLVKDYNGIRPGDSVLLNQRANSTADTWGIPEGVRKVDYVGANGLLVKRENYSDGVTRDYFFPPEIYTPLVTRTSAPKKKPPEPQLASIGPVPAPKKVELPLVEQRYYIVNGSILPWRAKKFFPVVIIKKEGGQAFVVDARHFKDALKLRNDIHIFKVPLSKIQEADTVDEYSQMLQAKATVELAIPGNAFKQIFFGSQDLDREVEDEAKKFSQLHTHLLGSLCGAALGKVAE